MNPLKCMVMYISRVIRVCHVVLFATLLIGCKPDKNVPDSSNRDGIYANIEFQMPRVVEPKFPEYSVKITEFGAIGDGQHLNTKAIAEAIENVSQKGGGKVIIPKGIWLTGPMVLKSNINIHTEHGALVLFSPDFDLYPLIETSFEGLETYRRLSPIYGKELENIAFTGKGVFDGSGDAWRPVKKSKMTAHQWEKLLASGGVVNDAGNIWYPSENALKGARNTGNFNVPDYTTREEYESIKDFLRPVMVSFVSCKNVLLDGPTFQNSPAWCLHPLMCENVIIRNLTVKNPWYSQNGDGLDLESCKNALIYNNNFDVGDDAICIKSGKNEDGRKRNMPTENVIIKNNIVYHGHGGFTIGSEMSGGVKNIHVSDCMFIGTDVGLRFKSTRGRGGIVEEVYISDIDMIDIPTQPIRFNLFYEGNSPIPEDEQEQTTVNLKPETIPEVTEETPQFKNIYMRDIRCKGAGQAIYMQGLPEMFLDNIRFKNILIEADRGIQCINARNIVFNGTEIIAEKGVVLHFYNGRSIELNNFSHASESSIAMKIEGSFSDQIILKNTGLKEENIVVNIPDKSITDIISFPVSN